MHKVTHKSYARIGLIGNPSDGYGGKTLSAICKNFHAQVTLEESNTLTIEPDVHQFRSVSALQKHIQSDGYYGAGRLFTATINVLANYLSVYQPSQSLEPCFRVTYQTDIPRMVGLAGSSALVVAMLKALIDFYSLKIDKRLLPSLALDVERRELNIGGGLQDRVIQIYEGLVSMDFGPVDVVDGFECGRYEALDTSIMPPLYLAYRTESGEPTEVFHNSLRARYDSGEGDVINAMDELVSITDSALVALKVGDHALISALMDKNFDIRRSISDLNPRHIEMIEVARACGVSAKYAGSGGAIVGVCMDDSQYSALQIRLGAIGCEVVRPMVA